MLAIQKVSSNTCVPSASHRPHVYGYTPTCHTPLCYTCTLHRNALHTCKLLSHHLNPAACIHPCRLRYIPTCYYLHTSHVPPKRVLTPTSHTAYPLTITPPHFVPKRATFYSAHLATCDILSATFLPHTALLRFDISFYQLYYIVSKLSFNTFFRRIFRRMLLHPRP